MKKNLPVYLSRALVYVLIIIGLYNFYTSFLTIETIIIPASVIETQEVPLVIKLIIGIVVFILSLGFASQIFITYWDYIVKNKFSFIAMSPFMLLSIGTLSLIGSVMSYVKTLIEVNSVQFIANLGLYITACDTLGKWLLAAGIIGATGVIYNIVYDLYAKYVTA